MELQQVLNSLAFKFKIGEFVWAAIAEAEEGVAEWQVRKIVITETGFSYECEYLGSNNKKGYQTFKEEQLYASEVAARMNRFEKLAAMHMAIAEGYMNKAMELERKEGGKK